MAGCPWPHDNEVTPREARADALRRQGRKGRWTLQNFDTFREEGVDRDRVIAAIRRLRRVGTHLPQVVQSVGAWRQPIICSNRHLRQFRNTALKSNAATRSVIDVGERSAEDCGFGRAAKRSLTRGHPPSTHGRSRGAIIVGLRTPPTIPDARPASSRAA